jgi:8-amino-3,8-dideoxy-alpha-D-manno-octulosonate transaminase
MTANQPLVPYEWPGSYYYGEEEIELLGRVIRSRSPFRFYGHDPQGFADALEAAFCHRLGRKHALSVNSATSALSIAMTALRIGPGDEVLIPGYLWVACIGAVVRAGAIPRLVEVDESFVMDPDDLRRKVTPHSKAVLIVNMCGATGRLDELLAVAREHNLLVIEDVAQAAGGSFRGKPLGSFGDVAVFSFQLNKNMTAGDGGLLATDDEAIYERAFAAHDLGYPRNAAGRLDPSDPEFQGWGQGSRMNELTAAVLVAQEQKLDTITGAMRRWNHYLYDHLAGIAGIRPRLRLDPAGDSGPFVLLIYPDAKTCQAMCERTSELGVRSGPTGGTNYPLADHGLHLYSNNASLVNKRGVNGSRYPWAFPENAFAATYRYDKGTLPASDALFARTALLTCPPTLSEQACAQIVACFRQAAGELGKS